jgi:hypothetical protein
MVAGMARLTGHIKGATVVRRWDSRGSLLTVPPGSIPGYLNLRWIEGMKKMRTKKKVRSKRTQRKAEILAWRQQFSQKVYAVLKKES